MTMSALTASASSTAAMPASRARAALLSLRPPSTVVTVQPRSTSRFPTALPIIPGAMTATTGLMRILLGGGGGRRVMRARVPTYSAPPADVVGLEGPARRAFRDALALWNRSDFARPPGTEWRRRGGRMTASAVHSRGGVHLFSIHVAFFFS